jgi:hypothetical protein
MGMFEDYRFWGFIISNVITITCFLTIKLNDFRHLTKDVEKIFSKLDLLDNKFDKIDKTVAILETKTEQLEKSKK